MIKYTIHGFQQDKLIEKGFSSDDALVMSVVKEMYSSSKTEKIIHDGEQYVWVKQTSIVKYIPILGSLRKVQGIFKKITDNGVFKSIVLNSKNGVSGKFYYIKPTDLLDYLSDFVVNLDDRESTANSAHDPYANSAHDQPQILHNKDSPIIHSPIIKYSKDNTANKSPLSLFDEWWNLYPRKLGKANAKKTWVKNKLDSIADEIIKDTIERTERQYKNTPTDYIPYGSTYLSKKLYEDEIEDVEAPKQKMRDLSGMDYKENKDEDYEF